MKFSRSRGYNASYIIVWYFANCCWHNWALTKYMFALIDRQVRSYLSTIWSCLCMPNYSKLCSHVTIYPTNRNTAGYGKETSHLPGLPGLPGYQQEGSVSGHLLCTCVNRVDHFRCSLRSAFFSQLQLQNHMAQAQGTNSCGVWLVDRRKKKG